MAQEKKKKISGDIIGALLPGRALASEISSTVANAFIPYLVQASVGWILLLIITAKIPKYTLG